MCVCMCVWIGLIVGHMQTERAYLESLNADTLGTSLNYS